MESQRILCCSAKKWTLVIGWIQTVGSAVILGMLLMVLISYFVVTQHSEIELKDFVSSHPENRIAYEAELAELKTYMIVGVIGFALLILATIISFAAGMVLIRGVQNKIAKNLKIWMVIEFIFLVLEIIGNIMCIVAKAEASWTVIYDVLSILISLFILWVVNVHRQELLGNSGGQVIHSFKRFNV